MSRVWGLGYTYDCCPIRFGLRVGLLESRVLGGSCMNPQVYSAQFMPTSGYLRGL